jgi:hypothetical protein
MRRLTVHDYAADLRPHYRPARWRDKGKILDEFCKTTRLETSIVNDVCRQHTIASSCPSIDSRS